MGHEDYYEDRPELPPEAGDTEVRRFDPDDEWIKTASKELQIEAMRRWFYGRYEDPVEETPYSSEEGGYIFIHGGPYDPNDEIQERFSHVVEYEVMDELIQDLYGEVGDEWAPIDDGSQYYDDELSMLIVHRTDPHRMLSDRLEQIEAILTVSGDPQAIELTIQLAHGAVITALESYLWDIVSYWAANDEGTLRMLVATNKDFQSKSLQLSAIFERMENLKQEVDTYLQELVWHRLDKVKPLIESGLKINVTEIGDLMGEVLVRHDIVHRGGRTKKGEPVSVSGNDVRRIVKMVSTFADEIETELNRRYPEQPSNGLF
jgi:hypothetical protein